MEKSEPRKARNFRGCAMTAALSTFDLASDLAAMLRPWTPKAIAKRIGASPRTVENWKDGANGPTWKHTVAMLNDDQLAPELLRAAGRDDLAKQHEILSLERRLEALKQAGERLKGQQDEIRMDLAGARQPLGSRAPDDGLAPDDEARRLGAGSRAVEQVKR